MLADLHIHTNRSSYCSSLSPEEMFDAAQALGLDAVAVTEHSVTRGAQIAYEMGLELGFTVFRGIEVYTRMGDIIVFGLDRDTHYDADFGEVMEEVRRRGALAIAAHPARGHWGHHRKYKGMYPDEALRMMDAVETHNGQNTREANLRAIEIERTLRVPGVGGSDAHDASHVGRCVTVLDGAPSSEEELIRELRAGRCRGAYLADLESGDGGAGRLHGHAHRDIKEGVRYTECPG
jgi:predicted metal-dependent phosphoesterase TrpH